MASNVRAAGGLGSNNNAKPPVASRCSCRLRRARGSLMINNMGKESFRAPPLPGVDEEPESSPWQLQDLDTVQWFDDLFIGYQVNLKDGTGSESMTDDPIATVLSNQENVLKLTTGFAGKVKTGDLFHGIYNLDHLDVLGGAQVTTTSNIIVWKGNLTKAAKDTLQIDGSLVAGVLELVTASTLSLTNAGVAKPTTQPYSTVEKLIVAGKTTNPIEFKLTNCQFKLDKVLSKAFTATNATLTAKTMETAKFVSDSSKITTGTLKVVGDADLFGSSLMTLTDDLMEVTGHTHVSGTSVLTHSPIVDVKKPRQVKLVTNDLTVNTNARIDVTGKGYAWEGAIPGSLGAGEGAAGASHGGRGSLGRNTQSYWVGKVAPIYGSLHEPTTAGMGSQPMASACLGPKIGRRGGGVLKLEVKNAAVIDGHVAADGQHSNPPCLGSGSVVRSPGAAGGSIWLDTPNLGGKGAIHADGSAGGGYSTTQYGGGGGGRVAVTSVVTRVGSFGSTDALKNITAYGGQGQAGRYFDYQPPKPVWAASGTVWLQESNDKDGHLFVTASPKATQPTWAVETTELLSMAANKVLDVTQVTAILEGKLIAKRLVGLTVLPSLTQGSPG